MPTGVAPDVVYDTLAAYLREMREAGLEPPSRPMTLYQVVGERLGMDYSVLRTPWQKENAQHKFVSQVRRMLYKLTDNGLLVKAGSGRELEFITPQEHQRRVQERSDAEAAVAGELHAWRSVKARLRDLGLIETGGEGVVVMPLPVWEQLLNLAEKGERSLTHLPFS